MSAALWTVAAGWPAGSSAALGGGVAVAGSLAYGIAAMRPVDGRPLEALRRLVRAEALKICVVVLLLWVVFKLQAASSLTAFFLTFVLAVLVFSVSALARDR